LLEDLDQAPALGPRQRARLHDPDQIALPRLVAGVMGVQSARSADDLLVLRVTAGDFNLHGDRLVGLARDDAALPRLAAGGTSLRRRGTRAGGGLALGAALRTVGGAAASGLLALLATRGGTLLRALFRPRVGRAAGALQAAPSLPVEALIVSCCPAFGCGRIGCSRVLLGSGLFSRLLGRGGLLRGSLLLGRSLFLGPSLLLRGRLLLGRSLSLDRGL